MYEVTLGSPGIQQVGGRVVWSHSYGQIGWATVEAVFSGEEGVGDVVNTYAYDGKRKRRWNVGSRP